MPSILANQIHLEYETFGDPAHPSVLLIMGLYMQMLGWPEAFCQQLADQGFHVIRFDNRDTGLSDKFHGMQTQPIWRMWLLQRLGLQLSSPYTLHDMALDAVGLLDALDISTAHVVGASMGGAIGQILAAQHANRVRSFTSIMSFSGDPRIRIGDPRILLSFMNRPRTPEAVLQNAVRFWQMIDSPNNRIPDEELRQRVQSAFERSFYPQGFRRHLAAILASGDRSALLRQIRVPTLVLHGKDDRLVYPDGGRDTASKIPDARFHLIEGMGHLLPPNRYTAISRMIAQHAQEADARYQERRLQHHIRYPF
ncbi:MAG: alpha/beta fold hydrolase [Myxococcales bacterium]|nr:alpha/beta fold hydrolase [Myxococcales bacterium]MCB9641567.1 alpha/beta fold hydrolase [Myxococcales bacterium]